MADKESLHRQQMAEIAIGQMLNAYKRYQNALADESQQIEAIREFQKRMATEQIEGSRELFMALPAQTPSSQPVEDAAKALTLLINKTHDPWLRKFLETDPNFTEAIGGIPDWLPASE